MAFYVAPISQPHLYNTHPDIGLEMDAVLRKYPGLNMALVACLALLLFGNVGLVVRVWPAFKNPRIATRSE
jgi:hypothetical protein